MICVITKRYPSEIEKVQGIDCMADTAGCMIYAIVIAAKIMKWLFINRTSVKKRITQTTGKVDVIYRISVSQRGDNEIKRHGTDVVKWRGKEFHKTINLNF